MDTAREEMTVQDLIDDLYNLHSDAPISLRDADGNTFSIAGFETGSSGVVMVIKEEE